MEGLFAVILLLLAAFAVILAVIRLRKKPVAPPKEPRENQNALLPKIGSPGSVQSRQIGRLRELHLDAFDLKKLSKEQATILLDACTYLLHVWEKEKEKGWDGGDLTLEIRDSALNSVLSNSSFLERIIVSEEAHYETRDEEIPEDACYWHVVGLFKGLS